MMQFALNLEHLESDFFLHSALGYGLDEVAPYLVMEGPPPTGAQKAHLDFLAENVITEFGFQEVGHLRSIFLFSFFIWLKLGLDILSAKPWNRLVSWLAVGFCV